MTTVLSIIQRASSEIGVNRPTSVFSQSDRTMVELQDVTNEMAEQIANAHEWQRLKTLQTFTGNGTTDKFPLPDNYGRMGKDQNVWSTRFDGPLEHITSTDEWLQLALRNYTLATGAWHIHGGFIDFFPVLEDGEQASLYYLSKEICESVGGTGQTAFEADDDVFRLPERLLRLGIILHHRRKRGLPFDSGSYGQAMVEEIARDGGSVVVRVGRGNSTGGARVAYPQAIVDSR